MTQRRLRLFLLGVLAWTTVVSVAGLASTPKGLIPYVLAHAPGFVVQIAVLWLLVPAVILLALLGVPDGPVGGFVNRVFNRGRPTPPDRPRWMARTVPVVVLFAAFGQAWQTVALVLYWHRRQLPWVAQAMQAPHWGAIPDPHHLIPRLWPAVAGLLVAWFGNGLPKLLSPFRGGAEPYDWSKMIRACGWAMTLGGLGAVACSLLVPDWRDAVAAETAVLLVGCLSVAPIWALYRLLGHRDVAPPTRN
jgi:hypothetical protein